MEFKGSANRIQKCACDLLSIGTDLMDDDESWDLVEKEIQLKSTFLYSDLSKIIAGAPYDDQKKSLTKIAQRLFCSIEELDDAVKNQSIPLAQNQFGELALVLQELVATFEPLAMPTGNR